MAPTTSDNAETASKKGILIIPTSLTGSETQPLTADFELTEEGTKIKQCPNGEEPDEQKYNERTGKIDAKYSHDKCDNCPLRDQCPGVDQKWAVKVSLSKQMVNRAEMQESLGTEEHKQFARERNAVEGIPSVFRRFYGIDQLRTTIATRVKSAFFGILISYNSRKHQKFLVDRSYAMA